MHGFSKMKIVVICCVALTAAKCTSGLKFDNFSLPHILEILNELGKWNNSKGSPLKRNVDGLQAILTKLEWLEADRPNYYTVEYLAASYGYPIETHHVTTFDGYILTIHRIPSSPKAKPSNGRVAFIQHGILCSAADWLIGGPEKSLGFLLADEGYDVWLGNTRGNTWSKNHITLSSYSTKFWDFSWHEMGIYDLPVMIDYVLKITSKSSLYYVGHSEGTTIYYVMLSKLPQYNSKIKVAAHLSPIGFMNHLTSPLWRKVAQFKGPLEDLYKIFGSGELLPTSDFFEYILSDEFCAVDSVTQFVCTNPLFVLFGYDFAQMNGTLLPKILKYSPAGCSTKQVLHYVQEIKSGYFRQWEYNIFGNLANYGTLQAPDYRLSHITAPTFLFWSSSDTLSANTDVKRICSGMGAACRQMLKVNYTNWNHLDYIYGSDVRFYVNDPVINLFNQN